jgi:hypothetical protein
VLLLLDRAARMEGNPTFTETRGGDSSASHPGQQGTILIARQLAGEQDVVTCLIEVSRVVAELPAS